MQTINYINTQEVEEIINDSWSHMPCTEKCNEHDFAILDLSDTHIHQLEFIYEDDLKDIQESSNQNQREWYESLAQMVQNELFLINTFREQGYKDNILILIGV